MSDFIETFKKTRKKAQMEMVQQKATKTFSSPNKEIQLCGKKNVGILFGCFIADKNNLPYRIIKGYRYFRINKQIAEKYGIKDFALRICDPDQYCYSEGPQGEEEKKLITKLTKVLESVEQGFEGIWKDRIALYPPQYNKHMTIQYMKVLRRTDLAGVDVKDFDPGVKVIMSRSDAYYRRFEGFIDDQNTITNNLEEVLMELLSRDKKNRTCKYMIKSVLPPNVKSYEFTIQQIPEAKGIEITENDLYDASDLNKEIIDITEGSIDIDELNKWCTMFKEEYKEIKNSVMNGTTEDKKEDVPPTPEPTVVKEEPKPEPKVEVKAPDPAPVEDLDNPFE